MEQVAQTPGVLVLAHIDGVLSGVGYVRGALDSHEPARIDILAYGRHPSSTPLPAGTRRVAIPERQEDEGLGTWLRRGLRWALALRRARYQLVVVSQPALDTSRGRGLLRGAAVLAARGRTVSVDATTGQIRSVSTASGLADLGVFVLLQAISTTIAEMAALVAQRLAEREAAAPAELPETRNPARVLYLRTDFDLGQAPLVAGGSLAHTEGILAALARRGHEPQIWSTGEIAGLPASIPKRRLPVLLRGNIPREVAELISGLLQGLRVCGAIRVGMIYQRYSLNNFAGLLLARRYGAVFVLEANASEAEWRRQWSTLQFPRLAAACERLLLRRADRVLAVSDNAAADLRAAGAREESLRVVPNGVDVERFRDARPRDLPFGQAAFVVAFAGLFYPWHGVSGLAEAFALLHGDRPEARLLLVGDGEDAAAVRAALEDRMVLDSAVLTGLVPRDEVPGYLAAADVLVSPHVGNDSFIGSPVKLWEYMASGRAIVATRVAQLEQVLRHRQTALLVEPDDPEELMTALRELYDDSDLRAALGANAAEEARRLHSWDARLAAAFGDPT